jgi:hypothetical protein
MNGLGFFSRSVGGRGAPVFLPSTLAGEGLEERGLDRQPLGLRPLSPTPLPRGERGFRPPRRLRDRRSFSAPPWRGRGWGRGGSIASLLAYVPCPGTSVPSRDSQASCPFGLSLSKPCWKTLALPPFGRLRANGVLSVRAEPVEALLQDLGARALRPAQGERYGSLTLSFRAVPGHQSAAPSAASDSLQPLSHEERGASDVVPFPARGEGLSSSCPTMNPGD